MRHVLKPATVSAAVLLSAGGTGFIAWLIYVQPDAQGAIAVMFTPVYQLLAVALLLPICTWLFARRR